MLNIVTSRRYILYSPPSSIIIFPKIWILMQFTHFSIIVLISILNSIYSKNTVYPSHLFCSLVSNPMNHCWQPSQFVLLIRKFFEIFVVYIYLVIVYVATIISKFYSLESKRSNKGSLQNNTYTCKCLPTCLFLKGFCLSSFSILSCEREILK